MAMLYRFSPLRRKECPTRYPDWSLKDAVYGGRATDDIDPVAAIILRSEKAGYTPPGSVMTGTEGAEIFRMGTTASGWTPEYAFRCDERLFLF